jgi:hypothetical protein
LGLFEWVPLKTCDSDVCVEYTWYAQLWVTDLLITKYNSEKIQAKSTVPKDEWSRTCFKCAPPNQIVTYISGIY